MTAPIRARFERRVRVPFSACDPAGLMFFPQYFLMFQDHVEAWVSDALGISYAELLGPRRIGLPSVRWETDFRAISRMGDWITIGLEVEHVGSASLILAFDVRCDEATRVTARQVIVCTSLDTHRSMPLPDDLRHAMHTFLAGPL